MPRLDEDPKHSIPASDMRANPAETTAIGPPNWFATDRWYRDRENRIGASPPGPLTTMYFTSG